MRFVVIPDQQIVATVSRQLSWSHVVIQCELGKLQELMFLNNAFKKTIPRQCQNMITHSKTILAGINEQTVRVGLDAQIKFSAQ